MIRQAPHEAYVCHSINIILITEHLLHSFNESNTESKELLADAMEPDLRKLYLLLQEQFIYFSSLA